MAKNTNPLKVTASPAGVAFTGGSFEERVNATVEYIVAKNGGSDGLKAIFDAYAAANPTGIPSGGFICGTAEVTRRLMDGTL